MHYFSVAPKNPPKTLCKNSPKNPQKPRKNLLGKNPAKIFYDFLNKKPAKNFKYIQKLPNFTLNTNKTKNLWQLY